MSEPNARAERNHPATERNHPATGPKHPASEHNHPATRHNHPASALGDTATLTGRSLTHVLRSPDTIVTTAIMPIAIMLLFVYVLGGAIRTGQPPGAGEYVDYVLPGILTMTLAMGVSYTSYRLFMDLQGGIVDRFHSLPIARGAVLWAHVITSVLATLVSVAIVIGVAVAMGFRSRAGVGAWLAVVGLLALLSLALTWIAVVAGLAAHSVDGASAFSYPLVFLPFISSAFVPTDSMPGPVRWFAQHQPITPIIDEIRALLAAEPITANAWIAPAWCVGIGVAAYGAARLVYRRRIG